MVIVFGTKEARDQLMTGMQKLEYNVSPRDLEDLNGCTDPTEVVIAFPNDNGQLMLTPSGIDLANWNELFSEESVRTGEWVNELEGDDNMAQKKIYVLAGYHYHPDKGEHDIISAVFHTREAAAKKALKIFQDTFPNGADEFTLEDCMYGNNYSDGDDLKLTIEEFSV